MNWLLIALGAVPALALSWLLHTVDVNRLEMTQRHALEDQAEALQAQCTRDKEITAHAEQSYQDQITALNTQLGRLRNVHPPRCVVPTANATKRTNAAAEPAKLLGPYGLSTEWLYDYAGEAEAYRLRLIALQGFIRDTWKANNQ